MPSTSKLQLHPRNSLRRLRTAFSSSPSQQQPQQPNSSLLSSTTATSPLSSATSRFSSLSSSNLSSLSLTSASFLHPKRVIRRKKSVVELEQEEERSLVGDELMALVEPRPSLGAACGTIEEVLEGRI